MRSGMFKSILVVVIVLSVLSESFFPGLMSIGLRKQLITIPLAILFMLNTIFFKVSVNPAEFRSKEFRLWMLIIVIISIMLWSFGFVGILVTAIKYVLIVAVVVFVIIVALSWLSDGY